MTAKLIVTDEQAIQFYETVARYMRENADLNYRSDSPPSAWLSRKHEVSKVVMAEFVESLSTDQLKQLAENKNHVLVDNTQTAVGAAKGYLENNGYSVVEWVEFDEKNGDIPDLYILVCSQRGQTVERVLRQPNSVDNRKWLFRCHKTGMSIDYRVTHYCELPQRKESK